MSVPVSGDSADDSKPLSIVICWAGVSGYMAACWRALLQRPGVTLSVLCSPGSAFDLAILDGLPCHVMNPDQARHSSFAADWVAARRPDVVVVCGWNLPHIRRVVRDRRLADVPFVMTMDNPWRGSFAQHLAPYVLSNYMKRFSCILVPGERAHVFARRLVGNRIKAVKGAYGINCAALQDCLPARASHPEGWPKRFLFSGRYDHVKAPDVLVRGYQLYRDSVFDPWPLTVTGRGPLAAMFANQAGISDLGFVEPRDQPRLFTQHGVFVLTSRYDPWPLVVVEASASGLPVVCTDACGSAVELVRDYFSGLTCASESPDGLAKSLTWMHRHHDDLPVMGARAVNLAAAYSAEMWATRWLETLKAIRFGG